MGDRSFDPSASAPNAGNTSEKKPDYTVKKAGPSLGSLAKASFTPPKMETNENSAAYAERVRKAREAWTQRQAMSK